MLGAAIAQVVSQGARPPDRIIASLGGEAASLRLIDLPAGVEKKAAEVLPGELGALLPFDVEDAVIDYQVVGRDESTIQLMAVAAPRRSVAERLRELQSAASTQGSLPLGQLRSTVSVLSLENSSKARRCSSSTWAQGAPTSRY